MHIICSSHIAIVTRKIEFSVFINIMHGFRTESAKVREELRVDLDSLSNNLYHAVHSVEDVQSFHNSRITHLEETIARMQRNSELVICGVPAVQNESCINIVTKIAGVINCRVNLDLVKAFRLGKPGTNPNNPLKKRLRNNDNVSHPIIMVKLASTSDKNDFMGKYLAYKSLSLTDDIGFSVPQRIFIK